MESVSTYPISFPNLGIEWNPPVNLEIPFLKGVSFNLYGLIIALGLILAVVYGLKRRRQFGLLENDLLDGVLCIVPFAIICTRLFYCIFKWDQYKEDPISMLYIWKGGLAIYGGVIGAAIGIIVFCLIKKIRMGAVFDITALGFMIGQSVGRWGNFFNREAFGSYSNNLFAMRIHESYLEAPEKISTVWEKNRSVLEFAAAKGGYAEFIQVHPTFLYESAWNLVGFALLHFLSKKRKYDGQIALGYVAWYGLGRTFIEGYRMDSLYLGDFRVSQLLAALTCIIATTILVINMFRYHDPEKLYVHTVQKELDVEAVKKEIEKKKSDKFLKKLMKKSTEELDEEIDALKQELAELEETECEEDGEAAEEAKEEKVCFFKKLFAKKESKVFEDILEQDEEEDEEETEESEVETEEETAESEE